MGQVHFLELLGARLQYEGPYARTYTVLGCLLVIILVHYAMMHISYSRTERKEGQYKKPPRVPYLIPIVGNIPWQYFWDPIQFFSSSKYFARKDHPVLATLLGKDLYVVQGPEHVLSLLGHTSTSNRIFNSNFLHHACGMSAKGVARFDSPDEEPPNYPGRKNYLNATPLYEWSSADIHTYLTGRNALHLFRRFEESLRGRIQAYFVATSAEGVILTDFLDFFSSEVVSAMIDSMCGKGLVDRNPKFPKAFWVWCDNLPTFMKRTPYVFAKQAWTARDHAIEGVKDWQAWASAKFDPATTPLDENGDDQFWGSKFFRERYKAFVYDLGFDPADMASLELGFLLGATANATLNTYWCALEVYRDTSLLRDVRKEVDSCKVHGGTDRDLQFDVTRLLQQPLLQAVFAENLRLRCHNMFMRKTSEPIDIGKWLVPASQYAVTWSTPRHMDPGVWCKDPRTPPVDVFYPGRFLKPTGIGKDAALEFSTKAFEGSWIPFGSGANICPGRNFAKMHAILTVAMMVDSFDCDVLAPQPKLDLTKFGMGVLGPKRAVPVRIKRREGL